MPFGTIYRTNGYEQPAITSPAQVVYNTANNYFTFTHSSSQLDATAVRLADTTITFTGPTITNANLRAVLVHTGSAVRWLINGINSVVLTIAATTITVTGAGTAPIPAGSLVTVFWAQNNEIYQDNSEAVALVKSQTKNYYIDMANHKYFSIQWITLVGGSTKTLKVYMTNQDDGTLPAAIATWSDITSTRFGSNSFTAAAYLDSDTPCSCRYIKIEIVIANDGDDLNTWKLYSKKSK